MAVVQQRALLPPAPRRTGPYPAASQPELSGRVTEHLSHDSY